MTSHIILLMASTLNGSHWWRLSVIQLGKDEKVCQDVGLQDRCGAGIWCAPSSVENCLSPSKNVVAEDHAWDDDLLRDHAQHDRWERASWWPQWAPMRFPM
jgi:hypothetical protein